MNWATSEYNLRLNLKLIENRNLPLHKDKQISNTSMQRDAWDIFKTRHVSRHVSTNLKNKRKLNDNGPTTNCATNDYFQY